MPFPLALMHHAEVGVTRAIRILGRELDVSMALCGVSNVSAIGPDHLLAPE